MEVLDGVRSVGQMGGTVERDRLADRVVVVTGAGRGIGAEYATQAGAAGAQVVVNDVGRGVHGEQTGEAATPADEVADAIVSAGGRAVADHSDVATFDGASALINRAVEEFGTLDVLINNAGILRDRMLVSMSEQEFDDVVRVHLRGHFATSHHAADYWRTRSRAEGVRDAVLIQTTSIAGLHGNVGQFNYSAAKAGIASMAINGHLELNARYGVRSFGIAPSARTRLTLSSAGIPEAPTRVVPSGGMPYSVGTVIPASPISESIWSQSARMAPLSGSGSDNSLPTSQQSAISRRSCTLSSACSSDRVRHGRLGSVLGVGVVVVMAAVGSVLYRSSSP
jgi:NAD(P)-dependent dehydrogenase (short-subunit alcohol dehydrogenase family)